MFSVTELKNQVALLEVSMNKIPLSKNVRVDDWTAGFGVIAINVLKAPLNEPSKRHQYQLLPQNGFPNRK